MDLRIADSIGKISRRFRKPAGGIHAFMICGFPEPAGTPLPNFQKFRGRTEPRPAPLRAAESVSQNPAMGGADVAQRRRDAKGCALVRTHPVGECLLVGICFFFAPLRDIPSPDLG
jgi:hypothetical protein